MEQLEPIEPQNARERELRDRAVRDYAALNAIGLETGRTFFPPGTEAFAGKDKIRAARRAFEALPEAEEALVKLTDAVLNEDRQDLEVTFGGYATGPEAGEYNLVPTISGGFAVAKKGGAADLIRIAPTERFCQALMAKRPADHAAPGMDLNSWRYDVEPHAVVVRHRKLPGFRGAAYGEEYREGYALVSPKYKAYDLDAAANDLKDVVPSGSKARVRYDGQRATLDIVLQNPYRLDGGDAAGVGETHRVVMRVKTADDGSGGYHVSLLAERVRCVNLTLLHAKKALFHGTHRQENLRELAKEALDQVAPTMEAFAAKWREGWGEYYADKYAGRVSGEEAIRRIVAWGKYRIPGLGKDGTLDACLQALAEEPGDSKLHVHNAMTRAAHASPVTWATRWADDAAEEQASQLLYQKVAWLPEVPPEAQA